MLKKTFSFLLLFLIFTNNSFALDIENTKCNSDYLRKLELCRQAIKSGSYKSLDFMCIQKNKEMQLFQIVLDDHFKKIDEKMKKELEFLDENKDYYFRNDKDSPSFIDWLNDIEKNFWVYWKFYNEYKKACFWIINNDFASCYRLMWETKTDEIALETLIYSYKDVCFWLAKTKLEIYSSVAFEMLLLDKIAIRKDNRTSFSQDLRKSYSNLARLFDININLLEKILFKWPLKIKEGFTW